MYLCNNNIIYYTNQSMLSNIIHYNNYNNYIIIYKVLAVENQNYCDKK